jgi:hypothetical protein
MGYGFVAQDLVMKENRGRSLGKAENGTGSVFWAEIIRQRALMQADWIDAECSKSFLR